MKRLMWCGLLVMGCAVALPARAGYIVTDLGYSFYSPSLNASGQVVGYTESDSGGYPNAYLYSNGTTTNLGGLTLGGNHSDSYANGINASGQVVGQAQTSTSVDYAFLYSNGTMTALNNASGVTSSGAQGINASGQVVGTAVTSGGPNAFLYSNGTMTLLGNLPGYSSSYAYGINDSGQVVGYAYSNTTAHAFVYNNGSMTDLGTLGGVSSYGFGINDSGQVVGLAQTSTGASDAFLYTPGTGMIDLSTFLPANAGITYSEATGINDSGQIVVYANDGHSYLLTPQASATPEPATLLLLGQGAAALLGLAWRSRRQGKRQTHRLEV